MAVSDPPLFVVIIVDKMMASRAHTFPFQQHSQCRDQAARR